MENKKVKKTSKIRKTDTSLKRTKAISSKKVIAKKPALKTSKKVGLKVQPKIVSSKNIGSDNKVTNTKVSRSNGSRPKVKKPLRGTVLLPQVNGSKCVRVRVLKYVPHPLYKKLTKKTKIYLVACGVDDVLNIGDEISFVKTRPISKKISFRYIKDLEVK